MDTIENQIAELKARADELAPRVALFNDRGRKPRELTSAEKHLALTDADAFEEALADVQDEHLDLVRDAAAFDALQDEIGRLQGQLAADRAEKVRAERQGLLVEREQAAEELQACLNDFEGSLSRFLELSSQVSKLDRQLGEADRHKASYGLVSLHLKRLIQTVSPKLARLTGVGYTPPKPGHSLADAVRASKGTE